VISSISRQSLANFAKYSQSPFLSLLRLIAKNGVLSIMLGLFVSVKKRYSMPFVRMANFALFSALKYRSSWFYSYQAFLYDF